MIRKRPDVCQRERCRGRLEARRTGANAIPRRVRASSGSRRGPAPRGARWGTRCRPATAPCSDVVRAVGAGGTARVDHPPARLTRGQRGEDATAVGEAHQVVEVVVDVLRLPLAVHGADALGDLVVVAVGGRDTVGDARAQRADEVVTERFLHRCQHAVATAGRRADVEHRAAHRVGADLGGGEHLGRDRTEVGGALAVGVAQQVVDRAHRLGPPQPVEHHVLLVGEHPLELAGAGDDQRRERLVAPLERARRDRIGHVVDAGGVDVHPVDHLAVRRAAGRTGRRRQRRPALLRPGDRRRRGRARRRARRSAPVRRHRLVGIVVVRRRGLRPPGGAREGEHLRRGQRCGRRCLDARVVWRTAAPSSVTAIDESGVVAIGSSGAVGSLGALGVGRFRGRDAQRQCVVTDRRDVAEARLGHHHRHRAGGRRQVDVLVELAERCELGHHVDGHEPRPFEGLHQPVAAVQQLVDLLAGEVAPLGQLPERPLAVGARLLHHLPALLLGHGDLRLGIGVGVAQPLRRLGLGGVAELLGRLRRLLDRPLGGLLGLDADGVAGSRAPRGRCAPSPRPAAWRSPRRRARSAGWRAAGAAPASRSRGSARAPAGGPARRRPCAGSRGPRSGRTRGATSGSWRRRPPPARTGRAARTRWPRDQRRWRPLRVGVNRRRTSWGRRSDRHRGAPAPPTPRRRSPPG